MKYIRTKEKIYEVESTFLNNNGKWIGYNIVGDDIVILREQVISQADTIEELCDEFVCKESHKLLAPCYEKFNDEGYPAETYQQGILNAIKSGVNYINYTWCGAIWTDKGLIYATKPIKGEPELI